ncbi:methyltransferase domain-containing protein [Actinoplanes sp. NPDC026619]|uniref:methyltransferase domain-containing protein n=1 Tax=Actinoplanes sp. NPDC026619 TaxID=3155798 RepID=UPI00340F29FE
MKRPSGVFTFDLRLLAEDRDGTWLWGPVGSPWHAPHDSGSLPVPVVIWLAAGRPWAAWWVGDPADRRLEIDICLPPEPVEGGWRYVDLELDPVLHVDDGRVEIEDWDEWEESRRDGWMSAADAELARVTAERCAEVLRRRDEPWLERGWQLLRAAYWDTAGATKTFTHPLDPAWLAGVDRSARILDYGCGYGRLMAQLSDLGFTDIVGVDVSPALIARGRQARPDLDFAVLESPPVLNRPAASFDVILLFAVLTCVPDDDAQRALVAELHRLLAPGGLVYVSDLVLQPDKRYSEAGVFTTTDGAVCRHHEPGYLRSLFADFELAGERHIEVETMNGNRAAGLQMLVRRR